MTVYTTLPTDDLNLAVEVTEAADLVELNITPAIVYAAGAGVISVNGAQGVVVLDTDDIPEGTTNLYSDQPNSTTDDVTFNSVTADFFGVQYFTAKARETISAGQPVYISGHSGNTPEVMVADYDDPAKMPAFGIASADIANNNNGSISTYGDLKDVDTTGSAESETWAVGDELFVNGSKLTNIRPSLETQEIQKIAKVIRVHANNGQMFLLGAGRSNDIPNLTTQHVFIGNGTGYDKRQLTYTDILATPDLSNYITASSSDTLTNKSGSNSQWTNDEAYIKADSTDTLTNKSGSNSQWTNDEGYTTNTGTVTPSSTDTFTNKSGNISQWTNDAGYLTSETDNQTLSFANPNLSISNGNSVDLSALNTTTLAWSAITSTPTTIAGYGITDAFSGAYADLTGKPTIPTQTVINNNADNRIITGSATADTLEGEANFTWDGTNGLISGTTGGLTAPVMKLEMNTSNWNTPQMMLTDANDDCCSLVGSNRNNFYEYNFTLDPNNTNGRTGATTFAGDYFVAFRKDYSDPANVKMGLTAYGAHGGFDFTVRGDYNSGGGNQYKGKPLNFNCEEANFNLGPDRNVLALTVQEELIDCKVPIGQARLSSDPANPAGGWTYYNTTTNKLRLYVDLTGWVDLN